MKGIKKLDTSTNNTKRPRIYAEVSTPQPVTSSTYFSTKRVQTGHLNATTRRTVLEKYSSWAELPDSKFTRELFALLYVSPVKGIAPSKRKRDLYRLFKKSLQIMWYQSQNAQALAQAS